MHESEQFLLLTKTDADYSRGLLHYLETTRRRILSSLRGIAHDEGYGKHVALIFDDGDDYLRYLAGFDTREGEIGLSSGVFLGRGYGHLAMPFVHYDGAERTIAHEMTHALVDHLPLPLWLNEGLATNMEDQLTFGRNLLGTPEERAKHGRFWGEEEVQQFWSGESFGRADEGQELSYELAQLAVKNLSQDYDDFVRFVEQVHYRDAGEEAAQAVYEGSLGNLMAHYFGEGDWVPNPELWNWPEMEEARE